MPDIPAEAVQAAAEPAAFPSDCSGEPHAYASMRGAHCPIWVDRCYVCGAINWADLAEQAARIAAQVRRETAEQIHDQLDAFAKDCHEQSEAAHKNGDREIGTREAVRCVAFARASGVARQIGQAP